MLLSIVWSKHHINGLKIVLTWFDRFTMTGHPELVEGCTDSYETINKYSLTLSTETTGAMNMQPGRNSPDLFINSQCNAVRYR